MVKPQLVCIEPACPRRTFTPSTTQLPSRARCTSRLRHAAVTAVIDQGQPVDQVARIHGDAWWTAQTTVNTVTNTLPDIDTLHVTQIRIDKYRYRRVRWYREPDTDAWARVEP